MQSQCATDAARQRRAQAQTESQARKKAKIYTNDDIPEAKQSTPANSGVNGSSDSSRSSQNDHGDRTSRSADDSVKLDLNLSPSTIKRPKYVRIDWSVQNTSDHTVRMDLISRTTGPCDFHDQQTMNFELRSGAGLTDNQLGFVLYEFNCPGVYRVELQVRSNGKVLSSASAEAQAE